MFESNTILEKRIKELCGDKVKAVRLDEADKESIALMYKGSYYFINAAGLYDEQLNLIYEGTAILSPVSDEYRVLVAMAWLDGVDTTLRDNEE